jgi:hypothetical protein
MGVNENKHSTDVESTKELIENKHSDDVESTNQVCASLWEFGLSVRHAPSACSQRPCCQGREDNALVITTASGNLQVKIMPRQANLEASSQLAGPPPEQDIPLVGPAYKKYNGAHSAPVLATSSATRRIMYRC